MTKRERLIEKLSDEMDPANAADFVDSVIQEALQEKIRPYQRANGELDEAYLRLRKILNAYDTAPGGTDRFEVTEAAAERAVQAAEELHRLTGQLALLHLDLSKFTELDPPAWTPSILRRIQMLGELAAAGGRP